MRARGCGWAGGVLMACAAASAPAARAADLPLWELGMGVGALNVPHYRGSDQNHNWLLPVPGVPHCMRNLPFRSNFATRVFV